MTAVLVSVATAITDDLNNNQASFATKFTAERSYGDCSQGLEDQDCLHVDVIPMAARTELGMNGYETFLCDVDIWIRKRFSDSDRDGSKILQAAKDNLMILAEEIESFFVKRVPTSFDATWKSSDLRSHYNSDHLRTNQQFTAVVRVTYEVDKAT